MQEIGDSGPRLLPDRDRRQAVDLTRPNGSERRKRRGKEEEQEHPRPDLSNRRLCNRRIGRRLPHLEQANGAAVALRPQYRIFPIVFVGKDLERQCGFRHADRSRDSEGFVEKSRFLNGPGKWRYPAHSVGGPSAEPNRSLVLKHLLSRSLARARHPDSCLVAGCARDETALVWLGYGEMMQVARRRRRPANVKCAVKSPACWRGASEGRQRDHGIADGFYNRCGGDVCDDLR